MLTIGEFAGVTGLSVKALRHYDDKDVLVPADVDERSGYRRYSEAQVRAGAAIRALRDAGVGLPEVAAAVASGDAERTLEEHHRRVLAAREREDQAFLAARGLLRALAAPISVTERTMPAQPFVGQVIPVPLEEASEITDEDANHVFGALFVRLNEAGFGPSGPFWTALRVGERGQVEVVCCWPTTGVVPAEVCGPAAFCGELPPRTELAATWRSADGEALVEGALHPAVVALFDALADRDLTLGDVALEVRQSVHGESDQDYAVEVAVTVVA